MFKSLFRRPESSSTTIANNSKEPEQQIIEKLRNWNPPTITIDDVYEKETYKFRIFRSQFAIKEVQKTLSIRNEFEVFPLLERKKMLKHMKKFQYLHIRLIQVAVKPLTMKGLNTSLLVCLRDDRVTHFNTSLLAVAESSLCDGPIYFNCYPTYSIALEDFRSLDVFTLNIKTHGLQREQGSGDIVIWYKVIYSVSTLPVWYGSLSVDDRTTFIQTNLLAGNVEVSKTVQLDAMEFPERWRNQN